MRVCHMLSNPYVFDTRVKKQCEALVGMGCEVTVVATHRTGMAAREETNGVLVIRKPDRSEHPAGLSLLGRLILDWMGKLLGWKAVDVLCRLARPVLWLARPVPWLACRTTGLVSGAIRKVDRAVRAGVSGVSLASAFRFLSRVRRRFVPAAKSDGPTSTMGMIAGAKRMEEAFPLHYHVCFWAAMIFLVPVVLVLTMVIVFTLQALNAVKMLLEALAALVPRRHPLRWASMIERGYRADANVYQANDYDTLLAAYVCSRLRGAAMVYDSHELFDESFPNRKPFMERYWIRIWEGFFARRAVRTLTVCDSIGGVLARRYGLRWPVTVRNAQVHDEVISPNAYIRKQIGDPDCRRVVFVYAGRITYGRGLLETVEAFADIPSERAALVIMGTREPTLVQKLEELIDSRKLNDRVYLLEPVPSELLPGVLAGADVGLVLTNAVCLSYYHGLGNKIFHCINAGIPVMIPPHPEKVRLVTEHDVGYCVRQITADAISREICRIIDAPQELAEMKRRCAEAAPKISWQVEQDKYLDLYVEVYESVILGRGGKS